MAIRHGKMTENRKWELLAKIERIASNDISVFAGVEHDIGCDTMMQYRISLGRPCMVVLLSSEMVSSNRW